MPWRASNVMNERIKFCLRRQRRWDEAEGGRVDVAELCRVFGISRQRGYVWLRRSREASFDARALEESS
jgi:Helix-turn-helix domain